MKTLACCLALGACGCAHAASPDRWYNVNFLSEPGTAQECIATEPGESLPAAIERNLGVAGARVVKVTDHPTGQAKLLELPGGGAVMFASTETLCHALAASARQTMAAADADDGWYFANPHGGDCDPMSRQFPEAPTPTELQRLMADTSGMQLELTWNGDNLVIIHDPSGNAADLAAVRSLALCRQVSAALAEIGGN